MNNQKKIKIVTDSSSDILTLDGVDFSYAPLKVIAGEKEFLDDENIDVPLMVEFLDGYKGRSSTACPGPGDWIDAFGDADEIYCVTITGTLSGCYNSAKVAKEMYESDYPERRVCVIDSLSTGPEMQLIVDMIAECVKSGEDFETIIAKAEEYRKSTGLLFMLKSMKNLANNGRVKPLVAKAAGLLNIHVVGRASDIGDLEPLAKCRGEAKAIAEMVNILKGSGVSGEGAKVKIAHCFNPEGAEKLKEAVMAELNVTDVEIYPCRGLCSFYAEMGGLLVGYLKS